MPAVEDFDIAAEKLAGNTILVMKGELSSRTVSRAQEATTKALLSEGRVVVDISALRPQRDHYALVFPTAQALAGGWPRVKLAICGADRETSQALIAASVDAYVPVFPDRTQALRWLDQRPRRTRAQRRFPPEPASIPRAVTFVAEVCRAWRMPAGLVSVARVVCAQLVTHTVEHAGSCTDLTVQWTENGVLLSVRDQALGRPPTPATHSQNPPDNGLTVLGLLAEAWGVRRHPTGTTIWARLRDKPAVAP